MEREEAEAKAKEVFGPVGFTPIWKEDADSVAEAMTKGEAYARLFLPTKKVEKII